MKNPVYALWDALAEAGKSLGDGLTLAAEILCPRDHTAEERLRSWESAAVAVEGEICDEAEADEDYLFTTTWADYYTQKSLADLDEARWCYEHSRVRGYCPCSDSSAAVSAAADPSPTVPNAHSVVGGDEEIAQRFRDLADALHPEADPGEVTAPSPGERVITVLRGHSYNGADLGHHGPRREYCTCGWSANGDGVHDEHVAELIVESLDN